MNDHRRMYRFFWNCGRQGEIEGIFFATARDVEWLEGKYVWFGEVLGKHSEIGGTIDPGDVSSIPVPPDDMRVLLRHAEKIESGFNPLRYAICEYCQQPDRPGHSCGGEIP